MSEQKNIVIKWYYRAQFDYFDRYINLYISYNAWFKKATNKSQDRAAIDDLKKRVGIWQQYINGDIMQKMCPFFNDIVAQTNESPLINLTGDNIHWDGIVIDSNDWPSLIEYWYRIRCNIFHGSKSPDDKREATLVMLAFESLNVFMTEIVKRMEANFDEDGIFRLYEIYKLQDSTKRSIKHDTYYDTAAKNLDKTYLRKLKLEEKRLMSNLKSAKNLWEIDL